MKTHYILARPQNTITNPGPFFAERLQDDSNVETEWLWAANQVSDIQERLYCLQKALYINPKNRETLYQVETLTRSLNVAPEKTHTHHVPALWFRLMVQRFFPTT